MTQDNKAAAVKGEGHHYGEHLVDEIHHIEEEVEHALGKEYEHTAVPMSARRSMFSVSMVWMGFPMIITGAMTGSLLVLGMGFKDAMWAILIGNLIMFGYVGLLGLLGTKKGFNFALLASIVFGRKGYALASGLLSTLLLGWYAVQTGIAGALLSSSYDINYVVMTIIAGALFIGITFIGVRGLHWIGIISAPLFVVLALWVAIDASSKTTFDAVMAYPGNHPDKLLPFGVGLTMVIALFIDAGTVTPDFNRWAKDKKSSLVATFSAFPFANMIALILGGVMTAALAVPDANPFGKDNMFGYMMSSGSGFLVVIAFVFLLANLGSVCSHCLYNASTGWSRILRSEMRLMAIALGVIGIIVAATNVWAFFIQWLSLLGIIVPPIGAIIIVDQYLKRPGSDIDADWRPLAFIAWAAGSVVAFIVEKGMPGMSTAISSALVGGITYWVLMTVYARKAAIR
ncbi:purine-cytosine permease family protein [Halothiobacillus diazotrophicus]|uniref:purine-cytosine permease family protein n=1 Tax=Halothiobacillus diazotrophicus TaxID=1860122 RepID=UPI0009ED9208|nr:cytosine permease [Halothiobacillus diazotrophicus]